MSPTEREGHRYDCWGSNRSHICVGYVHRRKKELPSIRPRNRTPDFDADCEGGRGIYPSRHLFRSHEQIEVVRDRPKSNSSEPGTTFHLLHRRKRREEELYGVQGISKEGEPFRASARRRGDWLPHPSCLKSQPPATLAIVISRYPPAPPPRPRRSNPSTRRSTRPRRWRGLASISFERLIPAPMPTTTAVARWEGAPAPRLYDMDPWRLVRIGARPSLPRRTWWGLCGKRRCSRGYLSVKNK